MRGSGGSASDLFADPGERDKTPAPRGAPYRNFYAPLTLRL
jgi:hypothetical protein